MKVQQLLRLAQFADTLEHISLKKQQTTNHEIGHIYAGMSFFLWSFVSKGNVDTGQLKVCDK